MKCSAPRALLALLAVAAQHRASASSPPERITHPLKVLTDSSRAIARGDFSQRVQSEEPHRNRRTGDTFNIMSEELEQFVLDLKRAANENRELFMGSIQMLAGAVDEKDPYTRGHSDRVTRYSMMIAQELGLSEEASRWSAFPPNCMTWAKSALKTAFSKSPAR